MINRLGREGLHKPYGLPAADSEKPNKNNKEVLAEQTHWGLSLEEVLDALPLTGPTLLSLRKFKDANEKMEATMAALGERGLQLSARPNLWQPYAAAKAEILQQARPVLQLKARFAAQATAIDAVIARTGRKPESLVHLPMVGRKSFWTVFLDPVTAEVLAFMPLDSY